MFQPGWGSPILGKTGFPSKSGNVFLPRRSIWHLPSWGWLIHRDGWDFLEAEVGVGSRSRASPVRHQKVSPNSWQGKVGLEQRRPLGGARGQEKEPRCHKRQRDSGCSPAGWSAANKLDGNDGMSQCRTLMVVGSQTQRPHGLGGSIQRPGDVPDLTIIR